jgi:hypothetical protein
VLHSRVAFTFTFADLEGKLPCHNPMSKGHSLRPPTRLDKLAFRLRRWPFLHRIGRWFRAVLWNAVREGFWEFARALCADCRNFGPPGRTFSLYQYLRTGWPRTNGRILLHDQGSPRVDGSMIIIQSGMQQHALQPWPIFWAEARGACLVTESLALIDENKALCIESAYSERCWRHDPASRFFRWPPPVQLTGNWTSIVSNWTPTVGVPIYGHWIHDALPRLALLPEFPPDTRIIVPPKLAPYQIESLKLLGLWERCRPTAEFHLRVERYFFSSPVSMIDCYNPYAVRFLRDAFLPKADPAYSGPRKFFFQRTGKRRSVANMEEICEFFRGKGWGVVKDVELGFAETIKLFSEADALCSNMGSGLSNVVFCKPGCTVMQLVPDIYLDGWVDWIAQVNQLNYHARIIPCGGPLTDTVEIPTELIQEFFHSRGVAF